MRLTEKQKQEIERVLLEMHDKLFEIREKTGLSISVAAYGSDKSYACVFVHTKTGIVSIDERSEIEGFFKSKKWLKRKPRKEKKTA